MTCCLALLLASCARDSQTQAASQPAVDRVFDDAARFLAGMAGPPDSRFGPLAKTEAWKKHAKEMEEDYQRAARVWLDQVAAFRQRELKPLDTGANTVFYPFSGPDILHAQALFPDAGRYVLAGLEPPGTLSMLEGLDEGRLEAALDGFRTSLDSVFQRSFFITKEMDRDYRGKTADGLLPAILALLARTDHSISSVRYVRIDEAGSIVDRPAGTNFLSEVKNRGVQIRVFGRQPAKRHTIEYFTATLARPLADNPGFQKYLKGMGPVDTFIKSASYLLHEERFALARSLILDQSAAVLQDDSGIPYKFFEPAKWDITLFGSYDRPYGSFKYLQQADLKAAYENSKNVRPLNFRIGYGFSKAPSNLLYARKKR